MSEAVENQMENITEAEKEPTGKPEETKAEKFIRLGEYRMNKAMEVIGRLENLSNKSSYEYTSEQVEVMFSVLEKRVEEVKAKFHVTKAKENTVFSFGTRE